MKNFLAIPAVMLLIPGIGPAQTNNYFSNDPVWTVRSSFRVSDNCMKVEDINYYTKGDTLIKGQTYAKIFRKWQGSYQIGYTGSGTTPTNCTGSYWYISDKPSHFLRSQDRKIFSYTPQDSSEYLMYNFDLQVGDTLPNTFPHIPNGAITVTAIDSIYTPYGYRRRFALSGDLSNVHLLEGIGHSKGLAEYMGTMFDGGFSLTCFSMNDTAYFPAAGPTCDIAVGLEEHINRPVVSVVPNPFTRSAAIHLGSVTRGGELDIFDPTGQKIKTIKNISGDKITIDRGTLSAGIYYYALKLGNRNVAVGKLVVAD